MGLGKKWFGGKGNGQNFGDATSDPIGTCRRSPDGEWMAIMWPSRPSPYSWAVTDYVGSTGFETPKRVAHWPIVGAAPGSPAAGRNLTPHPAPPRVERRQTVTNAPTPDDDALCANRGCGHAYADHRGGLTRTRCVQPPRLCLCQRFHVDVGAETVTSDVR
jgi:hypothetical protein